MFAVEAALQAAGGLAQGFGKILAGLGAFVTEYRALSFETH